MNRISLARVRAIQIVVLTFSALLVTAGLSAQDALLLHPGAQHEPQPGVVDLHHRLERDRRLQLSAAAVRRLRRARVAELGHARRRAPDRPRPPDAERHAVARAADHRPPRVRGRRRDDARLCVLADRRARRVRRIAAALSNRRKLSAGAVRQRAAPARSVHAARRQLSHRTAARRVRVRRRAGRRGDARADRVHASRVGARQPAGADHPPISIRRTSAKACCAPVSRPGR